MKILTGSLLVISSISWAESTGFTDEKDLALTIDTPVKFYISTETIPKDKWESIGQAIALANQEMGAERIELGGIFISPEAKRDNINSISFSNDFNENELQSRSRQTAYWTDGKITEVDIIVNIKSFDYSNDQTEMVSTLKTQFKKIFGR